MIIEIKSIEEIKSHGYHRRVSWDLDSKKYITLIDERDFGFDLLSKHIGEEILKSSGVLKDFKLAHETSSAPW